jgi:hypothetical protein
MINSNKRKLNLVLFLGACIFVSVAATKPAKTNMPAAKPVTLHDTGIFQNLKVLPQDISKDSLDHIMHNFTASLGVRCNFCHVFNNGAPDFPSDQKEEKGIARYMMKMTAEINGKYFNMDSSTMPDTIRVVRCFTCHRSSPHPDEAVMGMNNNNNAPPPGVPGQPPPPPPPQPQPPKQ